MWGGADLIDICAQITSVQSSHWDKNKDACLEQVQKQFNSVLITFITLLLLLLFYKIGSFVWFKYFIDPIETEKEIKIMKEKAKVFCEIVDNHYFSGQQDRHILSEKHKRPMPLSTRDKQLLTEIYST